jgi:hypothetical protein
MGSALLLSIIVAYFALWISGKSVEKIAKIAEIAKMKTSLCWFVHISVIYAIGGRFFDPRTSA